MDILHIVNNQILSSEPIGWLGPTSVRTSSSSSSSSALASALAPTLAASWTSSAMVSPIATIADRGCSADLIGKEAAELLVQEGVVDAIHQ